jgi:Flp pilus assembly protein TadG
MDKRKYFATDRRGAIGIVFAFIFPGHDHVHGVMVDVGMAIAARFELAYVTKVACTRLATARSNGMSTSDQLKAANAAVAAHLPDTQLGPRRGAGPAGRSDTSIVSATCWGCRTSGRNCTAALTRAFRSAGLGTGRQTTTVRAFRTARPCRRFSSRSLPAKAFSWRWSRPSTRRSSPTSSSGS